MSAYVVGQITVKEPEAWQRYRERVPATLEPWHATLLFRGYGAETLDGSHRHEQSVAIEFPDADAARGWFNSDAYQALAPASRPTLICWRAARRSTKPSPRWSRRPSATAHWPSARRS